MVTSALSSSSINHCTVALCRMGPNTHQSCEQNSTVECANNKVKISVNCRQSRSVSGRHGWLEEVNGGTGGSPDNLSSLIILIIVTLVAIITCICVLQI